MKIIAKNKKAWHNYDISDSYETGIVLNGDEVKSLRESGCSINEAFARVDKNELMLYNMHIKEFDKSSHFVSDPKRPRKLLAHKKEIHRLMGLVARKMFTLIPLKIYFNNRGLAKVEIALAKGRKLHDKRKQIKDGYVNREIEREMKKHL